MYELKQALKQHDDVHSVIDGVASGLKEQFIAGLSGSARSVFATLLQESTNKKTLIVTHQLTQAQQLYDDIMEFAEHSHVYLYPVNELLASELAVSSPELLSQRIAALTQWLAHEEAILIAPVAALKRMLPPLSYWEQYQLTFEMGQILSIDQTLSRLVDMGYVRQDMADSPGEFSLRGGIIDIYPLTERQPLRIELFDDEIDSIRYYDAESQRSLEKLDKAVVLPATELLLKEQDLVAASQKIEAALSHSIKKIKNKADQQTLMETIRNDIDRLEQCERFEGMKKYVSFFYDNQYSLLDYLPEDGLIILDEMSRIQETASHLDTEEQEWFKDNLQRGKVVHDAHLSFDWHTVWQNMKQTRIYMSVFLRHIPNTAPANIVSISCRAMQQFHGQMNLLQNEMERWHKANYSVIILAPDQNRIEKVQSVLDDYQMSATVSAAMPNLPLEHPVVTTGSISGGFELPMHKLAIITEGELFKQQTTRKKRKQKISNAERIKSYQELKVGDYVVHQNHGIGRYIGIETLEINNLHKDFMLIKYSGDDKLFVPIDQIDLVQKYVGSEGKEPKMYRLGGNDWKKVKSKVQSKVEDIADDLMKLYAEREAAKGYAFSHDNELQHDFEGSFPYQETDDQLRCVEEIKQDMEKERPMDRLLCGDVGYGKTEVAIRAAFKAIADGKQVAILVPTTILAQQHYKTVMERFQDYPINIGLLSRFRTRKQQTETLKGLKTGAVDIVIGTHRLLSKDVVYKDLGLLIVDEEQRFGVKHKEKIKQLKTNVDVLTLTATPIPRTLHMSMLGVRDLSVIETPPENRFPIQTYVMEYNAPLVREAIERELARGGQVYFLYNRVDSIEKIAQDIQALVPDSRVAVAHGQMNETELESVMFSFLEGEADVLVSTTIIETGVDIPNVNTLIVYNADRMGLSQLYQLRGRVGRSNRVAYAYFTYNQDKVLTEVSEKRLQAIKEFTELGSGFKIAMRDLSIRGAGNILGAQQHGFIDSVGFDMYSQMLKETVEAKKQGKTIEEVQPFEVELDLKMDAYIPDDYIADEKQKIDMYKRFQSVYSQEDIHDLRDELIDRFGDYPEPVENLLHVSALKMMLKKERVESVTERKQTIEVIVEEERSRELDGAKLFEFANQYGRIVQLGTEERKLKIEFKFDKQQYVKRYDILAEFVEALRDMKAVPAV
ncbi:transcription-repair coupling factor [Gracilibacillus alcaliphilus]|uniref:transcription-repair coupling factor n=1 Tax=Gracilibacillus alcaliphilus TaxID=1401441 RepID=UPI0019599CFF|nr:transcription-repair coupling factor [Gracilibacillus alcaliphilus]MBM7678113.1 transcription-repair coupling factor (superfamily II helicase) [Gracilibacillus alcaliphilus]